MPVGDVYKRQQTFIRALDRLNTFDLEREFSPWIRRVAANLCLNHIESHKPAFALDEERDEDKAQSPGEQVEVRERSEQIRSALASLPRHYQELSYDEIASELNLPLSDVKSVVWSGTHKLTCSISKTERKNPSVARFGKLKTFFHRPHNLNRFLAIVKLTTSLFFSGVTHAQRY